MGQTVTWITPYKFNKDVPQNVDFRIMDTFLLFYTTLLGFLNFRLYKSLNLLYPPKLDLNKDAQDAGLSALIVESALGFTLLLSKHLLFYLYFLLNPKPNLNQPHQSKQKLKI